MTLVVGSLFSYWRSLDYMRIPLYSWSSMKNMDVYLLAFFSSLMVAL